MSPPGTTDPRRFGTLAWTPPSRTATVTPAPVLNGHTLDWICQEENHHSPACGRGSPPPWASEANAGPAAPAPSISPARVTAPGTAIRRSKARLMTESHFPYIRLAAEQQTAASNRRAAEAQLKGPTRG